MVWLRRAVWAALFAAVLVGGWKFAAANEARVSVDYLFGQVIAVRTWLLLATTFGAGLVVGVAICSWHLMRLSLLARRYRKALSRLEAELHGLRALPLAPAEAKGGDLVETAGRPERGR